MTLPDIEAMVIPHEQQRYPTVGDWFTGVKVSPNPREIRFYRVSDMGNADYEFMVLIHEMIEHHLCARAGVTQEQVDVFDMQYEKDRAAGRHNPDEEPGDDANAPYHDMHQFATNIEQQICSKLGIHWNEYNAAINALEPVEPEAEGDTP